ncbi:MAG: hypothetical protein ACXIU7_11985 [Roseinatronobacter sp.]
MRRPRSPEFLARESYRVRRLMDAARLLPLFGFLLLLLPLLRPGPGGAAPPTAGESVYLFLVWLGLILIALILSRGLRQALEREKSGPDSTGSPGSDARAREGRDADRHGDDTGADADTGTHAGTHTGTASGGGGG